MTNLEHYQALYRVLLDLQKICEHDLEDALLDRLDVVWYNQTDEEINQLKVWLKEVDPDG